jgi:hypothetical protein
MRKASQQEWRPLAVSTHKLFLHELQAPHKVFLRAKIIDF